MVEDLALEGSTGRALAFTSRSGEVSCCAEPLCPKMVFSFGMSSLATAANPVAGSHWA